MPIKRFFLLLFIITTASLPAHSQSKYADEHPVIFDINHQFLLGLNFGKRAGEFNTRFNMHYVSSVAFKKYNLGLGVGFENENYFYLLPAYFHFTYKLWENKIAPQPFADMGLAFNTERDIILANSIPGILFSGGLLHSIPLGKSYVQMKLAYRYQETSTLRLVPSFGFPNAPPNETLVKHKMHRFNVLIGIKL